MDTEDGDFDGGLSGSQEEKYEKVTAPPVEDYAPDGMKLSRFSCTFLLMIVCDVVRLNLF